ncbi:MAG: NAD(P)-dependent oxidoreductase [Chloroflexota bacterium]
MTIINHQLHGKRTLVTGATGFIGGRLAQRLAAEEGAIVTGTGRSLEKVPFLKETAVTLQKVDLLDETGMRQAMTDQDIVFHVAAWLGREGGDERAYAINVTATEMIVKLAKELGVGRIVLVSSIASYGWPQRNDIDETHPLDTEQWETYGRTKAIGEINGLKLAKELGVELTVVRPGMVYGPRSDGWSVGMLKLVQKGTPVIFGDGLGHTYPIFIDNLIDGLLLTAVHPKAEGEAFNMCEPAITFNQFFGHYGDMCKKNPRRLPYWAASSLVVINKLFNLKLPINRDRLKRYKLKVEYPATKAESLLGYQIRTSIPDGMAKTEAWFKDVGML